MKDYDISGIFNEMQEYLIASMTRNLGRHEKWEQDEGFNWEAWQALQLEALEDFKRSNKKYVNKNYNTFKLKFEELLERTNQSANTKQEAEILKAIKNGFSTRKPTKVVSSAFFRINDRKLKAVFNAAENDLKKASTAMLRMANDQYRSTIYKAQVFADTGTMTFDQAIDMATKDFLAKGINCIEYKNGRRVGIDTYAEMVIRNTNKKAYLVGEGTKRDEWGIHTVLVSRYGACSPTCLPWQGKVYIDDVYSGGTAEEAEKTGYPLLSTAIAGGLFHPNCKHIITTFFEGITTIPKAADVKKTRENSDLVATQRYNERQIRKYKRLENNSLDGDNQFKYKRKRLEWQARNRHLIKEHPEMHRNYAREKVRVSDPADRFENKTVYTEDRLKILKKRSLLENDGVPKEFNYNEQKTNNLFRIFANIDKNYMKDGCEWMGLADTNSGELLAPIYTSKHSSHVGPSDRMMNIIEAAKPYSLTTVHNHPKKSTFSFGDVITTNNIDSIKESIVINNTGEVYFLSIPKNAKMKLDSETSIKVFKDYVNKQRNSMSLQHPSLSKNEINHFTWKMLAEKWGWLYGRKRM